MTILIVDDIALMRNTLKAELSKAGINAHIVEAGDGEEGWTQLAAVPVDLIFSDWNMPNMSGLEFLKKMRADAKYKDLPFIMLTSEGDKTNVIEALKAGATDYMVKPVNHKALGEKVGKIFSQ